jgi:hypothetical protein
MGWIGSNGPSLSGCMPRLFSRSGAPWHVLEVRAKGGCLAKGDDMYMVEWFGCQYDKFKSLLQEQVRSRMKYWIC